MLMDICVLQEALPGPVKLSGRVITVDWVSVATGAMPEATLAKFASATSAAFSALTTPVPRVFHGDWVRGGNGFAVHLIRSSTCAGVLGFGAIDWISAATPATCGADIEVPAL